MPTKKKILDHIHKLKRIKYTNGEAIFFCTNGACEYEINVKKALGKPNECWRCGNTFNLNEVSIRLAKPHCSNCTKRKDDSEIPNTDRIHHIASVSPIEDLRARLAQTIGDTLQDHLPEDDTDLL